MAKGDVTIVGGAAVSTVIPFKVDDRTTSTQTATIKPGDPVTLDNTNFVEIVADDGPVVSTGLLVGIAHNESTETSSAEGFVDVEIVVPFITKLRAKATTVANIDTVAKLLAYKFNSVNFDNASNVITIDENDADDPNEHGLVIVDGDIAKGTLDVYVKPLACVFGRNV